MKITKKILKEMIEEAIEEGNNSGYGDGKRKAVEIRRAYKSGKREEPTKEELLSIIQSDIDDYAQMYKLAFDMVWSATLTGPVVSKKQLPFANARDSKAARGSNQQSGRNPLYTLEEQDGMADLTPGMELASESSSRPSRGNGCRVEGTGHVAPTKDQ